MVKTHRASANISAQREAINIARFFIASKAIISNTIAIKPKIAYFFLFDFFILDCHANASAFAWQ